MERKTTTIWVCTDCMLAANGYSDDEVGYSLGHALSRIGEDEDVTTGMMWEDHAEDCPNRLAEQWVEECDCERREFSGLPCEGCGNTDAGERHALTVWYDEG